jgi:tetratricopeptide (TPR) repeat protein
LDEQRNLLVEAVKGYRRVLELDPDNDDARLRLAVNLMDLKKADEALPLLVELQKRHPDNVEMLIDKAKCHDQMGEQDEAVTLLDAVLARWPNQAAALVERGRLALQSGQGEQAETWLARASELEPGNYQAFFQYSQCLKQIGKAEQAKEIDLRVKQLEKDTRRAQEIFEQAMQKKPYDPDLHCEMGMIARRAGAPEEALRWFQSALKHDRLHLPTHEALADFYKVNGELGLAARHRDLAEQARRQKGPPPPATTSGSSETKSP